MIKAALDIPFDDPRIRRLMATTVTRLGPWPHSHPYMLQSSMTTPSRPKPIRDMSKMSFEDRLHDLLDRALHHAITHGRDPQGAKLSWFSTLRDVLAAAWFRLTCYFQLISFSSCLTSVLNWLAVSGMSSSNA